jgi:hypothetical protein
MGTHSTPPFQIHQLPFTHHLYTLPNDANTFLPPYQHTCTPTPTPFGTRWIVDIYLVATPLALSFLPTNTAMTALHNTLESMYHTHLLNPSITISPTPLSDTYSSHSSGIYHLPPNTYPVPEHTSLAHSPTRGALAWDWHDFVSTDGSKKGGLSPLGAATTHPASDPRAKILVTSTPPSHTIIRAEFAGIDIGLQLGHTHLLTDSAFSLGLIQGYMTYPSAYRHNIYRDTLDSITHTLKTRRESGIRTHLRKIKAHNHSIGNDLAGTFVNQVAYGHPPDTAYTTGSYASIAYGHDHAHSCPQP